MSAVTQTGHDQGLRIRREVTESFAVVLHVTGEIDLATAPVLDRYLVLALTMVVPPAPVVVDLSEVGFIASSGLAVLIEHHHRCARTHAPLRVIANRRTIRTIQITGLDCLLHLFPTVAAALAAG